jgi:putative component of membrane protein insertase Oxa1/YidC/SpoIIIJ protein YidD
MRIVLDKKKLLHSVIFFFLMFVIIPSNGSAEPLKRESVQPRQESESAPFVLPIQVFRNFISGADGDRCPMVPSCSTYALEAVRRHGSIIGWVMTCDRLMRCGLDETRHTPPVRVGQRILSNDPVENNDFWWE